MSITSALANANTGLSAASKRASVISSNVANALTPGYSKRDVSVSEKVVGGMGAGVAVNGVTRATDQALTNDRRSAEGVFGKDQAVSSTLASFNTALGGPDDPYSLFAQYQGLESSLRSLALTPESQPLQVQVLDAAKSLATRLNQLSSQAQMVRRDADTQIAKQVDFVNSTIKQIDKLNDQIGLATSSGRDSTGLEDQRKLLIDQVAKIIPVREISRGNNKVDLMTTEGVFLLAGQPREIEFSRANAITADTTLAAGGLSGLTVEGIDITPGVGGAFSLQQGELAGLFQVRDETAPDFQTKLDVLSRDIMERFEANDPTLAPGAAGLFTDAGGAFDPLTQVGLAGRIAINASVDPDQGGELWRIRDGVGAATEGPTGVADVIFMFLDGLSELKTPPAGAGLGGQLTAIDAVANITSIIGAARVSSETQLAANAARAQSLLDAETESTGVDSDLELQKLLAVEQAFSANARVIQAASQMIETLMEL